MLSVFITSCSIPPVNFNLYNIMYKYCIYIIKYILEFCTRVLETFRTGATVRIKIRVKQYCHWDLPP